MQTGERLAHYEVGERIGRGGMGEVWRARDTKLSRDVALKILPPEFAHDGERLARFEREAKVLASLHHPNIASIFGFETTPACTFLVMELVEGEDLAQVLKRGPLGVDEAVDIARQIAEGLEEAHEKGVVHRDLKPANVKRAPDGKVKVLDFGLARAYAGQTAGEEFISSAPTMTAAMTQMGTVLGTAAYMSPEQARGKEVDRRADIWAFGVILFEMLTGKQTFVGETASDTLAGILKSDPDWDALPENLPHQVERVLRRCLAKEPRQRLRDIGEARVRLEDPNAESGLFSGPVAVVADGGRRGSRPPAWMPWSLLVLSLAFSGWLVFGRGGDEPSRPLHLAVPAPDEVTFHTSGSFPGLPEVSPNGLRVAFSGVSAENNAVQLYLRDFESEQAVALSDTRDAQYPFWSHDSKWIAYYVRSEGLMKIPVDGGPAQVVCQAGNGKGGSWNQFDEILLTKDYNTSIYLAPAGGGEARPVTDLEADAGFNSHRHPQFLPDGRHFLYFARGGGRAESQIRWASLDGGPAKVVTTSPTMGYYASGYLVFVMHGDLVGQRFDWRTGELSGSPMPIVQDVLTVPGAAKGVFSVSTAGSLVYMRGEAERESSLIWRDRDGREQGQAGDLANYDFVALAPDARTAAACVISEMGTWDIWTIDLERNLRTRFTTDPADDADPVWSRDGRSLYFTSDRDGDNSVYRKEIGSPDPAILVLAGSVAFRLWDVSADGNTIFYSDAGEGSNMDLWCVDAGSGSEPRLLRRTANNDVMANLSPDEKWLSWTSGESGEFHVYVAPWPQMAPITQVSTTSAMWHQWVGGGAAIIYQDTSGDLQTVRLTYDEGRVRVGLPEPLFAMPAPVIESRYWAATADGARFLSLNVTAAAVMPFCNLVLDWPALLAGR